MYWIYFIVLFVVQQPGAKKESATANVTPSRPGYTYQVHILPILKSNCKPCHFPGGKVYEDYPFDDYATVASLGLKLNTRLKEKDKDVIEKWVKFGKRENSSPPE